LFTDFQPLRDPEVLGIRLAEVGLAVIARVVALQPGPRGKIFGSQAIPRAGAMNEEVDACLSRDSAPQSKRILDVAAGGAADERGIKILPSAATIENKLLRIRVDLLETLSDMATADFASNFAIGGSGGKV